MHMVQGASIDSESLYVVPGHRVYSTARTSHGAGSIPQPIYVYSSCGHEAHQHWHGQYAYIIRRGYGYASTLAWAICINCKPPLHDTRLGSISPMTDTLPLPLPLPLLLPRALAMIGSGGVVPDTVHQCSCTEHDSHISLA